MLTIGNSHNNTRSRAKYGDYFIAVSLITVVIIDRHHPLVPVNFSPLSTGLFFPHKLKRAVDAYETANNSIYWNICKNESVYFSNFF